MLLLTAEGSRAEGATIGGAQRGRAVSHHWTWGGPYYNTLITRKTDRKEPTNTILLVQYVVTLFRPPRACDLLTQAPLPLKVSSSALKRPPSLLLLLALIPSLRLTHDDASPRCAQASDQLCAGARAGHEGGDGEGVRGRPEIPRRGFRGVLLP